MAQLIIEDGIARITATTPENKEITIGCITQWDVDDVKSNLDYDNWVNAKLNDEQFEECIVDAMYPV